MSQLHPTVLTFRLRQVWQFIIWINTMSSAEEVSEKEMENDEPKVQPC